MAGRPTKCTPELIAEIVRYLEAGNWFVTSCALVGITEQTGYNWMARGRAEVERVAEDARRSVRQSEQVFVDFFESCTRARARAEAKSVVRIQKAAAKNQGEEGGDWKADAWFLERAFPRRWGRRAVEVEHSGPGGEPIQHVFDAASLSDEALAELERAVAAQVDGDP